MVKGRETLRPSAKRVSSSTSMLHLHPPPALTWQDKSSIGAARVLKQKREQRSPASSTDHSRAPAATPRGRIGKGVENRDRENL